MDQGDRVPPHQAPMAGQAAPAQPQGIQPAPLRRATDYLVSRERIYIQRAHYVAYRRYARLDIQAIFTSLVSLYSTIFMSIWHKLRRFMDAFPPPNNLQGWTHAARAYISAWFVDLYVGIRAAVLKTSALAYNQRFAAELLPILTEYDSFLTSLNASIRPTHIKLTPEDSLYIPELVPELYNEDIDMVNFNPFNITGFTHDVPLVVGLKTILKESRIMTFMELSTNTIGRPCWLFDWHNDTNVMAWFPMEGNFNEDDVALAYIVGVACTPKMGMRDVDDWQIHNGLLPANLNPSQYNRRVPRRWNGAYEITTIEGNQVTVPTAPRLPAAGIVIRDQEAIQPPPPAKKTRRTKGKSVMDAASSMGSDQTEPIGQQDQTEEEEEDQAPTGPTYRVRLTNWTYYFKLFAQFEQHTRTGALRRIICPEA